MEWKILKLPLNSAFRELKSSHVQSSGSSFRFPFHIPSLPDEEGRRKVDFCMPEDERDEEGGILWTRQVEGRRKMNFFRSDDGRKKEGLLFCCRMMEGRKKLTFGKVQKRYMQNTRENN
jgi:hypothetical protein